MTDNKKLYEITAELIDDNYIVSVKEYDVLMYVENVYIKYSTNDRHSVCTLYNPRLRMDTPLTGRYDSDNHPSITINTLRGDLIDDYKRLLRTTFIEKLTNQISYLNNLLNVIEKANA